MAHIINLLTSTTYTSSADALSLGPAAFADSGETVENKYYDEAQGGSQTYLEVDDIIYSTTSGGGTLSNPWNPVDPGTGGTVWLYAQDESGTPGYEHAVQMDVGTTGTTPGEVLAIAGTAQITTTTAGPTTTTAAPTTTTTTAPLTIEWDNGASISVGASGGTAVRTFTLAESTTSWTTSDFSINSNNNWSTAGTDITMSINSSPGINGQYTITISVGAYTGGIARDANLVLVHPDNSQIISAAITIQQGTTGLSVWAYAETMLSNTTSDLDFSTGTGWGGNPVTDATDSFGSGLNINILSLPSNGTIIDVTTNGTISTTPYTVSVNNGSPIIRYTPNTNFTGSDSFTYEAEDSDGNTASETVSVTVNAPANQAPITNGITQSCLGYGTNKTVTFAIDNTYVSDDSDALANLTFKWYDSSGNYLADFSNTDFTAINAVLNNGTLSAGVGFNVFIYTYTGADLGVGATQLTELFKYSATDTDSEESTLGDIQINILPEGNDDPEWLQTAINFSIDQYNTDTVNLAGYVDDESPGSLTFTIVDQGGTQFISGGGNVSISGSTLTYNSGSLAIAQGQTATVVFWVTVTDQYGEVASNDPLVVTYNVAAVAIIQIQRSNVFANSSEIACTTAATTLAYLDANQATNINLLETGDSVYNFSGGGNVADPIEWANSGASWFSVAQNINGVPTTRAIQVDAAGIITNVINCTVTTGQAWQIRISYSDNASGLCNIPYQYQESGVWQNVIEDVNGVPSSIEDVAAAGGQLFTTEIAANFYVGGTAPANATTAAGYYSHTDYPGFYWEYENGAWVEVNGDPKQECLPQITYQTYSAAIWYNATDRLNLDIACASDVNDLTSDMIYFRADQLDPNLGTMTDEQKLEYVMANNIVVYTSQELATQVDYTGLWQSTVFLSSEVVNGLPALPNIVKFTLWENENYSGYSGNYRWTGVDTNGILVHATQLSVLGTCTFLFDRPVANNSFCQGLNGNVCVSNVEVSRENVFYAFYSCVAKFENGIPYWPMYVIDGLHKNNDNSSSYIKQFVTAVGDTPVKISGASVPECIALQHKVMAVNMEDAISILSILPEYENEIRVISVNPVDIGFTSGATLTYGYADCSECLLEDTTNTSTFTLATVSDSEIINRSIPNFDLEKNYELDNISKPLLRTNPKLSTNAKLVVNQSGNMFIESIDATKELASVEYKKWAVNKDGQWSYDLFNFFKSSKTPSDQIFKNKETFSNFTVQDTFEHQIEEDYHYGTVYNYSKIHDEDFRMLAPIWLDKNLPKKFVIFRVKDPVGTLDFDTQSNYDNLKSVLNNSEIIKTFDLTRDSELGTYIRNHVQSESFPKMPITMNFDENQRSSYNGIDMKKGGFVSKGEYLYEDFVRQDNTLIAGNDIITGGFERNSVACANLINLEFLFNDDSASDYSVNRYFGLYVNDIDSGYGTLETANSGKLRFKSLNSYINADSASAIPPFKLIDGTPTIGYAQVSDKFYKIDTKVFYDSANLEVNVEDGSNVIPAEIKLAKTGNSIDIELNDKPGSDFVKVEVNSTPAINDRFAIFPSKEQTYRLRFTRLVTGETFSYSLIDPNTGLNITGTIVTSTVPGMVNALNLALAIAKYGIVANTWTLQEREDSLNLLFEAESEKSLVLYEKRPTLIPIQPSFIGVGATSSIVRFEELQVPYDLANNTFNAVSALSAGDFDGVNFSNQGSINDIVGSIVKSINSIDNGFTALTYDGADHFYIKTDIQGYKLLQAGIAIPNNNANQWVTVNQENLDVNNTLRLALNDGATNLLNQSSVYFFSGGNATGKSALVTLDSVDDVNINDFIETKSAGIYNKVIDIVDDVERLPLKYNKLVLEKVNTIEAGEIELYGDNLVRLGLFSMLDIHDMNFDFYDTSNSDLKELKLETPSNIAYEPELNDTSNIYPFGDKDNNDYTVSPINYFSGLNDVLAEEVTDTDNNNIVYSEFDRLQENYLKEYAVRSRVVPTINKWVLKDTKTVREQPYYLNANEAFGRSNFAPDLTTSGRDRLGMTHEWFYINNLPTYLKSNNGDDASPKYNLNESFSYINFMDGFEITPAIFKDTNYDYFDRFFVTEGFESKGDNEYKTFVKTNLQKKYTRVGGGNDAAFADTIFKGLKVIFKNRKEFTATNPVDFVKSPEFNGYRFSVLLNVKTAQENNDISYEVIQNKKFKYVVFFISVSLDDLWADNTLTRKLLYELNHSLVWKGEESTFAYSDIKLNGSMDLNSLNITDPNADDYLVISGLPHADGGIPQYLEQINKNEDDEFGKIEVTVNTVFGVKIYQLQPGLLDGQDKIVLTEVPKDITNGITNAPDADFSTLPSYLQFQAEYTYINGGVNAYKTILDSLSASRVANMLLREPNNIVYTTVASDGAISNNKFIILFEDGSELIKEAYIQTIEDDDKPESFKLFSGNIGYDLAQGFTYYPFLIRHNAKYTIDTTPVVTFTDVYTHMKTNTLQSTSNTGELLLEEQMYKHSLSNVDDINLARDYYKRYNRCGVAFNLGFIYDDGSHDLNWGYIKNHFYRKVNESNAGTVTKLSVSSDKLPLYPLIGEIAIDKKDVHIFKSSWDKNYYTRSLSGGNNELVPGTFDTKEERSYLASTIMKVKDSYSLLDFSVLKVESEEEQQDILLESNNTTDIVLFEDKNRIVMDFYITSTIRKELSSDGVLATIENYVASADSAEDKTTLIDDADLYIDENLVNLFGLNQINLYTQRIKGKFSEVQSTASIDALDNGGFIIDKNFTFKAHEQKPLNFRLIYNKRLGYSYRVRPMIKITS